MLPGISYFKVMDKTYAVEPVTGAVAGNATGAVQAKAAQTVAGEGMSSQIGKYFNSPPGILVVSGIATVYSGMLYQAAANQEEEAEANIKKIDRIMAEFKDSYVGFCPEGREDLNVPECYCYLAKGGPNPDRTKSKICQDLWAQNKYMLSAKAGDYNGISKFVDPVGCLTISGQFDENCKCKKFVDSKGNNACQKGVSINLPAGIGSSLMTSSGIKDVVQFAANAGNGNPMLNNFSIGSLQSKAIATDKMKGQILTKALSLSENQELAKIPTITNKNVDQIAKAIFGEKNIAAAISNSKSALDVSSGAHLEGKMADTVRLAEKKIGIDLSGSGRGLFNKKIEGKEALAFNLGGDAVAANGAAQMQDFPEQPKSYKIKGDISKQTDTSIFDIISNRYMQSGLKRLFEE